MYTLASVTIERTKEMPGYRFLFDDEYKEGISYAKFDIMSGKVYAFLKAHGIGKEDFVLINLTRSANQVIAMAGVAKAGAAFTITEAVLGAERIEFIKKDCSCKIEINQKVWDEIKKLDPLMGCEEVSPHDAAMAIYTSGSLGNPKGVLHEYGNMDFDMTWRSGQQASSVISNMESAFRTSFPHTLTFIVTESVVVKYVISAMAAFILEAEDGISYGKMKYNCPSFTTFITYRPSIEIA